MSNGQADQGTRIGKWRPGAVMGQRAWTTLPARRQTSRRVGDEDDDAHFAVTVGTHERENLVAAGQQQRPGVAGSAPMGRSGGVCWRGCGSTAFWGWARIGPMPWKRNERSASSIGARASARGDGSIATDQCCIIRLTLLPALVVATMPAYRSNLLVRARSWRTWPTPEPFHQRPLIGCGSHSAVAGEWRSSTRSGRTILRPASELEVGATALSARGSRPGHPQRRHISRWCLASDGCTRRSPVLSVRARLFLRSPVTEARFPARTWERSCMAAVGKLRGG